MLYMGCVTVWKGAIDVNERVPYDAIQKVEKMLYILS